MVFGFYRTLVWIFTPALWCLLAWRRLTGFENPRSLHEKRGLNLPPRPTGPLIWVHAASNGETLSALPLITRFLAANPHAHVLITTVTLTAADLIAQRAMPRLIHGFAPFDHPLWAQRFLKHWQPDFVIWVESELWPETLYATRSTGVPMVLVNGRLSARSAQRWRFMPILAKRILCMFDTIFAQTDIFAARFKALGAHHVYIAGNLKYMASPLPYHAHDLHMITAAIGTRPTILFASTHAGEEVLAARAHTTLKARWPDFLTIIIPRHPRRGAEILAMLKPSGLHATLRTQTPVPDAHCDIYIADTLGELGLFFSACKRVVMGNSFVTTPGGGHNPLEPAQFGCAIAYGPSMYNFADMTALLEAENAACPVASEDALKACLHEWLQNPAQVGTQGQRAQHVAQAQIHTLDDICAQLAPLCATRGIKV